MLPIETEKNYSPLLVTGTVLGPNLFFKADNFINFQKDPNKSQLRENFYWYCRWYLDSFCIPHVIDSLSRKPSRPYSGSPDCAPTCKIACWLEEACWLPVNRPLSFFINKKCLLYLFWVKLLSLFFLNFLFPNKPDLSYFFFSSKFSRVLSELLKFFSVLIFAFRV